MVNNKALRLVSVDDCIIQRDSQDRKKITNGPVYDIVVAKTVIEGTDIRIVTTKAALDRWEDDGLDDDQLRPFIEHLSAELRKHSERCLTSARITGMEWEVDCDGFSMKWNRFFKQPWQDGKKYYLKFGFRDDNPDCLIVSVHE